jgi:hypothetical protein
MGEIVTSLDALELTERRHNTADGRRLQRSLMLGRVGPARDPSAGGRRHRGAAEAPTERRRTAAASGALRRCGTR